jgi:hypothetical protein
MDYSTVSEPQWADTGHTGILCRVRFAAFDIDVPFIAMSDDPHEHGRQIFAELIAGEYGPIADYVPPVSDAQDSGA